MAKRRRRSKYKTRPPKSGSPETDDPSLQSRQVEDADTSTAPFAPAAPPAAPPAGIPSTGMPVAAVLGQQPPADNPDVEEQGYARGGAIAPDPGGYGAFTSVRSDPVARRRYSPRHVAYAEGGSVGGGYVDAMNYMPDPMREQRRPPPNSFDPYNMVGRQKPQVNPMLAADDQPTGYARGGPIAAAQVPAYSNPTAPPPSAANASLYADMAALRGRTVNAVPLQPQALSLPSSSGPTVTPEFQTADEFKQGIAPHPVTGGVQGDPNQAANYSKWASQGGGAPEDPWNSPFGRQFDDYAKGIPVGSGYTSSGGRPANYFAEGGAVPEDGAAPDGGASPDPRGYLNGDNAMDPQELDGILQQIAQLDPNQSEDVVNLTAIVQAAQSGDMDRASSILAGFRRRFDRLNASAQGAAAHGDMAAAAQLAGKAHSQVPDGMTVAYTVAPEGNVTATVSPSNASFTMDWQQFHDYLVGPATSFDHILENGLEKNLAIASGGRSGQQAPGENPAPTGYAEGGEVTDNDQAAQLEEERRRQAVTDVLEHTRQRHGLTPAGGRTALEEGVGLPREPAGGRTALSGGVGYEGPAGGQTAYQAGQARRPGPQTDEPDVYDRSRETPAVQTERAGSMPPTGTHLQQQIDAVKRLMPRTDDPAATGRRRTGSLAQVDERPSAPRAQVADAPTRTGYASAPTADPETTGAGAGAPVSRPAGAYSPANVDRARGDVERAFTPHDPVAERNAANKAAFDAARDRGDIYTTPRWSMDRLTKEAIPDIMQGKLFGRKNTVDYPSPPEQTAGTGTPARDTSPVDVEQRRAEAIQSRGQPQPSGGQPSRQQVEPHEQRMRDIDQQQQQLRQPIAPAGSFASQPKSYEGKSGVDRYNKEVVADQHRYNNEVHQRSAQIAEQRQQDQTIIRAFNDARKEGADTPELKDAYDAAMYRVSGGKLRIPKVEQPVTKKEEPGIMQRIFGGNSQAKPATMGGYGSPGTPPRAPQRGMTWYYSPSTGQFEERPQ